MHNFSESGRTMVFFFFFLEPLLRATELLENFLSFDLEATPSAVWEDRLPPVVGAHVSEGECALSRGWLCASPWTVVCQALLSMGFSRQKYWRGLPFPLPGDLPWPRNQALASCIGRQILHCWATGEAWLTQDKQIHRQPLYGCTLWSFRKSELNHLSQFLFDQG